MRACRRTSMTRRAAPVLLIGLLALGAGCNDVDFEEFSEVTKLRILGLEASPPGVAPDESVELSATVGTGPETGTLFYQWEICLLSEGAANFYRCADDIDEAPFPNTIASSTDESFVFEQNLLDDEALSAACDLLDQAADIELPDFISLPQCLEGLPVRVRLKICEDAPDCADLDAEIASRELVFLFEDNAARADRNANPLASALFINDLEVESGEVPVFQLADSDEELELRAEIAASEAQLFAPLEERGGERLEEEREQLQLTWFSTAGSLDKERGFFAEEIADLEELQTNTLSFSTMEIEQGREVTIWGVLRDNRGGLSSFERTIRVEATP